MPIRIRTTIISLQASTLPVLCRERNRPYGWDVSPLVRAPSSFPIEHPTTRLEGIQTSSTIESALVDDTTSTAMDVNLLNKGSNNLNPICT